jgi:hypothetical protein
VRILLLVIAGCGRVGFTPIEGDARSDAPPVAAGSLLAWYPMNDLGGTGDQLVDISGHGHHGTCVACPTVVAGRLGRALAFDGVTDRFSVPFTPELGTTTGFTVTHWVQLVATPTGRQCTTTKSFGAGDYDSWAICIEQDQTVTFYDDSATLQHGQATTVPIEVGRWRHVAIRWDGTTQQILLDGVVMADDAFTGIAWDDQSINVGSDLASGAINTPFGGWIDDLRIYDRALTDVEIGELAAGR